MSDTGTEVWFWNEVLFAPQCWAGIVIVCLCTSPFCTSPLRHWVPVPWRTWVFHWQCQQGVAEDTGSFEAQQTGLQILAPLLQASHWTSLSLTFPVVKWGTILLSCTVIRKMKCLVYNKLLLLIWMWVYKSVLNSLLLFLEQFTL